MDRKILTVALKGTSEQMKNHMLQAMSQRGAEMLREDMDALGPIKIKEVEAAQQQIIAVVRQLEAEGVHQPEGQRRESSMSSKLLSAPATCATLTPIAWRPRGQVRRRSRDRVLRAAPRERGILRRAICSAQMEARVKAALSAGPHGRRKPPAAQRAAQRLEPVLAALNRVIQELAGVRGSVPHGSRSRTP